MNSFRLLIMAVALGVATPAFATGTILCRSTVSPTDGPELWLVIGPTGVDQARFALGRERFATERGGAAPMVGQSWLDRFSLRVDIFDANADERLVRLDTRRRGGSDYLGVLIQRGRTWRVRCSEEG
jgi:hypothetical protein